MNHEGFVLVTLKIDLQLVLVFATSLAFGLALVPGSIILAAKLKAYSTVDFRRKNRQKVPLFGGLAVYLATLLTSTLFPTSYALTICLCALPIVVVGVLDDVKELSSRPKFLAQLTAVTLLLYFREPGVLVLEQVGLSPWAANLATGFWIIGVTNAFNLIDGMDGVAGGVAVIATLSFALMGMWSPLTPFSLMVAGATLAFLFFNWPRAKIYLGDSGSTFLGFALSSIASQVPLPTPHFLWVTAPMFVIAFPQVDAVMAMYRRARLGLSLFKGDHDHIHHRLQKIGLSVRKSLGVIYGAGFYCSVTALALYYTSNMKFALLVLFLTISALCAFLGGIHFVQLRLAQQVSGYSQTLIQKYFQLQDQFVFDPANFSALVFDLLPYYKELQQRGILTVDGFISALARLVEKRCPQARIHMIGSYSLVLLLSDKEEYQAKKLIADFRSLLEDLEILRNHKTIPEGVDWYTHDERGEDFLSLISHHSEAKEFAA